MTALQLSLLGDLHQPPAFDPAFLGRQHIDLGAGAWLEHVHGFLSQPDALFTKLAGTMAWRADQRLMYERVVDVPRLRSSFPRDGLGDALLPRIATALSDRYEATFDAITLALYRDGADSVAWHRDRDHRECERSVVAVLSLGGPRRFAVRPFLQSGARSHALTILSGDLVVMGGSSQRTVEHTVPKARRAPSRIAVMFRHSQPQDDLPRPSASREAVVRAR